MFEEAQDVFGEVQASVAASGGFVSIPDLYINLANLALTQDVSGPCMPATPRFSVCCDRSPDTC